MATLKGMARVMPARTHATVTDWRGRLIRPYRLIGGLVDVLRDLSIVFDGVKALTSDARWANTAALLDRASDVLREAGPPPRLTSIDELAPRRRIPPRKTAPLRAMVADPAILQRTREGLAKLADAARRAHEASRRALAAKRAARSRKP